MTSSRNICVVTGTRAEYGLLAGLMKEINEAEGLALQVIATGAHLSPEFGLTYREIEHDGFFIDKKIEMLMSSDSEIGVAKSMGATMLGFADALSELKPDILVVLGDRYEIFSVVATAAVLRIPVAHLHGGEVTEGAFDDSFRHSITKMSHLHFTSTESYRQRVIQLGEPPDRVFNTGAIGLDNINNLSLLPREEFEKAIGFSLASKNILVTFHPVTLESNTAGQQFNALLSVLDEQENTHIIFTKANADTNGRVINQMIDEYVKANPLKSRSFDSLGVLRYLSAMQFVDAVVGNSSSGIIEVPSFRIGTINIGDRQKGRIKASSVIDCQAKKEYIRQAFEELYSEGFQSRLKSVESPYGDGGVAKKIVTVIRKYPLGDILKKHFNDVSF